MESGGIPLKECSKPLGGSHGLQFESLELLVVCFIVSASVSEQNMMKSEFLIHPKVKQIKMELKQSLKTWIYLGIQEYTWDSLQNVALLPNSVPFKELLKAHPKPQRLTPMDKFIIKMAPNLVPPCYAQNLSDNLCADQGGGWKPLVVP